MRYWAYLAGKVVVAAAPLYGLLRIIEKQFPAQVRGDELAQARARLASMSLDLRCDLYLLAWFLLCVGVLYLIAWDQRRRCRVCLRRLMMPIETGARAYMLQLGQPRIESICPYGHGTLWEDDSSGLASAEWKPHSDNVWDELCAPSKDPGQEP